MGTITKAPPSVSVPNTGRLGSIFRVPIDYLLEVYENKTLKTAVTLPYGPTDYEQKRPSATVITHTLDGVVREHTENHHTQIMLKGVSGYTSRLGHTRDGGVSFLSGRRIMEEFDVFLNTYQTLASQKGHRSVYMVFRALQENQAYRVEAKQWEWRLAAQGSRFSYEWTLELEAYGAPPESPLTPILSPATEMLKSAQDKLNVIAGVVALGSAALDNVGSELNEVGETLRAVGRVLTAYESVVASADGLRTYVTETIPAIFDAECQRYKEAWDQFKEASLTVLDYYDVGQERLLSYVGNTAEQASYAALTMAGMLGVQTETRKSSLTEDAGVDVNEQGGIDATERRVVSSYTWRSGDTLQGLALRAYGDASRWPEIQSLNGMRSARHWGDGTPLAVGDRLYIPFATTTESPQRESDQVYGVDIAVDLTTGDLVLKDNDVLTKSGARNLEQGLALRLLTAQGESWVLPSYGLPLRVGGVTLDREVAYLSSLVSDQLKQDRRIRDVLSVDVLIEGDKIAIDVTIDPVVGDAMTVVTPYIREAQ